jgi:hypothetical protein
MERLYVGRGGEMTIQHKIAKLRNGGHKACEDCPIRNIKGYECNYPETELHASCEIADEIIKALEKLE